MKEGFWEDRIKKDADKKNLGSCHRSQRNIQTVKRKDLPSIQG